jgi:hypothetical protein
MTRRYITIAEAHARPSRRLLIHAEPRDSFTLNLATRRSGSQKIHWDGDTFPPWRQATMKSMR